MAKRTLNDRIVKALKPAKTGKLYDVMDTVVPGFGVRVSDKGRRTFVLTSRYPGSNNPTRRAIGVFGEIGLAEARGKAREWLELIRQGRDPQEQEERLRLAEQRKRANSFAAVAEDFITDKLPGERKGKEVERDIRREFIPVWGGRPITEVTAFDVRAVVKAAKDRGAPAQAHNLLGTARRLFGWAIDQQVYGIETSPCDRLKPKAIIGEKAIRTRILRDDELRAFWNASDKIGYPYGRMNQVLALTGQRKSEVAEARWSEFDLERKLWTIPAERMKADAAHVVPLTADVIAILESLPRFKRGDYLFSSSFGERAVTAFSKAKSILDKAMLAELRKDNPKAELSPFVLHDIRRTMRTGLSALPVPDLVRELVIAHTKPGLHKVYDQYAYLDEKRHALDLWAARLRSIVSPPPANVVDSGQRDDEGESHAM